MHNLCKLLSYYVASIISLELWRVHQRLPTGQFGARWRSLQGPHSLLRVPPNIHTSRVRWQIYKYSRHKPCHSPILANVVARTCSILLCGHSVRGALWRVSLYGTIYRGPLNQLYLSIPMQNHYIRPSIFTYSSPAVARPLAPSASTKLSIVVPPQSLILSAN
jgi:hypothetical protein